MGRMMEGPRIVCLGMNEESAAVIDALARIGARIVAICGLPAEAGGAASDYVDLSERARAFGVAWLPVTDINDSEVRAALAATQADALFVLGWSQLLTSQTIAVFPRGVVGSHPSPLPAGRGRAPVPWTILEDAGQGAVSLFRMTGGVDDGDILKQVLFDLPPRPTARDLYDLVKHHLAAAFCDLYRDLAAGHGPEGAPQNPSEASWRARRVPGDGWIDFRWAAEHVDRLVRAVSEPYPGAYAYLGDDKVIFHSTRPATGQDLRRKGVAGQILAIRSDWVLVQAGDVPLWLSAVWDQGNRPRLGARFGYRVEDELHALRNRVAALERLLVDGGRP